MKNAAKLAEGSRQAEQPLVSACIPVYNHEAYVATAIQSIIDQDYPNLELIVINDGSSDRSHDVVEGMRDACRARFVRFHYVNRGNRGLCATLNEMLDWAQGTYFAPLASDDQWLPRKTSLQVAYLRHHPEAIGVFSGMETIDERGETLKCSRPRRTRFSFEDILFHRYFLPAPSQLIRTQEIRNVGGYDPRMKIEDWNLFLKLAHQRAGYSFHVLRDVLVRYRRHGENMSRDFDFMHFERGKIISQYSSHSLYKKAMARNNMLRIQGFLMLRRRIKAYSLLTTIFPLEFDRVFLKVILRLLLPNAMFMRT